MRPARLVKRDLLEYDARYGVLICRECQYAIQKSALQSHLLRHKIYRHERQLLLSSIAQLQLFEPQHVPLPSPASPPINSLPIISGYRCTAVGCGNLCASSKRMRRHWSKVHGLTEPPNSSFAHPVKLQTFFRGTKLRYFEVTVPDTAGAAPLATSATDDDDDNEEEEQGHDEQVHDVVSPALLPRRRRRRPRRHLPTLPGTAPGSPPADLDLETLTYFHHFTATTSLTLPCAEHPRPASHYWQSDVVLQALRQRWLMYGLLAISACHLAVLADDAMNKQVHRKRSAQFFSEFSAGWEETTQRDLGAMAAGVEEEAKKAGGQIICILRCGHWALDESVEEGIIPEQQPTLSQLQSIMTAVREFIVPDLASRPDGVRSDDDDRHEEMFAQASRILKMRSSSDAGSFGVFSTYDNTTSAIFNLLSTLPSRMAETFGRPDSVGDVLASLSAIAALVECCDVSFASDEMGAAWRGMATWLTKVPDHFNRLVSRHDPAALVVITHWAALLVKRAEHCGCWFLTGLTKTILLQVAERLPRDDLAVQSLVASPIVLPMNSTV
ncbi:hypothetical protein V1525DRAFT_100195 [Lipomyces kononenkoae]|uniref:Uncharacterized protein n=1 Tax=Lipomyces kononenkoae TaxID=34357 RepID=A0ACC3T3W4_LIPKO